MGLEIARDRFADHEYQHFSERLDECLEALRHLLERRDFGRGASSLGAELEVSLVGTDARPLPRNQAVIAGSSDERLTVELDRFNLEANLRHGPLAGRPFQALHGEIRSALDAMAAAARGHGGRIATIGILPTLRREDLQSSAMTDSMRYRALSAGLRRLRHRPFQLHIQGADLLRTECDDVTFEGAATSFQVHLRVDPADFGRIYNAAQLATAITIAGAGNSPVFLGRRLWAETRVALFKQAVDSRGNAADRRSRQARVSFGRGWLQGGAFELFEQSVRLHEPILPVVDAERPLAALENGALPELSELRLHQGTVWSWNRPIFDPADEGHVRLELRALPSGPSVEDMLANVAFLVGLTLGLAEEPSWVGRVPFEWVHNGFYRAAQSGLEATLPWPEGDGPAPEVIERAVSTAAAGLEHAGVERSDAEPRLACFAERVRRGRTGAHWQLATLAQLEQRMPRQEALSAMLERYLEHSASGLPVHAWPLEDSR